MNTKKYLITSFFILYNILWCQTSIAQDNIQPKSAANGQIGMFSMGIGSTISIFSDGTRNYSGNALTGQMRFQLWKNISSEWFGDYAITDVQGKAQRMDAHGGFSIMPYFITKSTSRIQPYPVAGFCIDYSKFNKTGTYRDINGEPNFLERYSFASQVGFGTQIHLSEKIDLSVIAHYMFHLGNDIHAHFENDDVHFEKSKSASLEGHLLLSMTVNVKLIDLW